MFTTDGIQIDSMLHTRIIQSIVLKSYFFNQYFLKLMECTNFPDPYEVLSLSGDSTDQEIKIAYRNAHHTHHI